MVFSGKAHTGGRYWLADGPTRWREEQIPEKLNEECPEIAWQVQESGTEEQLLCSEILRESTHFGRVAASSRKPYEANWRMWVSWRSFVGMGCWLQNDMEGDGASGRVGRVHGVLLRRKREQGIDYI